VSRVLEYEARTDKTKSGLNTLNSARAELQTGITAYEYLRWPSMKKSAFVEATSAGINSIARYLSGLIDMRHRRQRPRMDLKVKTIHLVLWSPDLVRFRLVGRSPLDCKR